MKRKLGLLTALLAAVVFLTVPPHQAQAQSINAAIHGTVTDMTGAVIPNASVTALDTATGIRTETTTNASGYYIFPQLHIGGPYTITITANGFQQFKSHGLILNLNDNRAVDAKLKVGEASQTVEVQAAAVQVETQDTQLRQIVTAEQIEQAPLLNRDASGLQKLEPGSVESNDRFGTFSSNGNQTQDNEYVLNGADVNDIALNSNGIVINPDALAEEDFVTSTLNPDVSRNSGEVINQVIKSGTNQFHGDVFEFYRDTFLNNGNYFSNIRPNFHQNIYGATVGGPIIKNKLFFFLAYQGIRNSTADTQLSPVFSTAQQDGNFSGDVPPAAPPTGSTTSPDPSGLSSNPIPFNITTSTGTCVANPNSPTGETWAQCFASGNVIVPKADWNPISAKLVKQFVPASNLTLAGVPYYRFNAANTSANDQGVIRLDYHLSQRDSLWASSLFQSSPSTAELGFGGSDLPGFGTNEAEHFKIFMAAWTHTFSASMLNELRAGYYRFNFAAVEPAQVVQPSTYGFDITPQNPSANVPLINVLPLNGSSSFLGFSFEGPQPRKDTNLNAADNFTKIVGNHTLKFGVYYEQTGVDNPFFSNNNGSYTFNGGGTYSSGDPILDFVLGIPDSYTQGSGATIDAIGHEYFVYAQDSWRVTDALTLNYGAAWDTETPFQNHQDGGEGITCWAPNNQTSKVFPGGPPGLTYPSDPGCNIAGSPTTNWDHVGPRVGFAWSPDSGPAFLVGAPDSHSFALRGGFGVYWNRDSEEGQLQNLGDPPFDFTTTGVTSFIPGTSPGFANPYADVAGNGSVANPFPFTVPTKGQKLDWENFAGLDISSYPKSYTVPYAYNFNLNIQRALPSNMVLQVGYVGNIGRKLVRVYEGDRITPAGHAACLSDPACVKQAALGHLNFPQNYMQTAVASSGVPWYLSVGRQATDGASNYNSLQVSLQKGPTHGVSFTMAYTYSHALDNGSGLESSGFNGYGVNAYPGFQYLSYGDSDFDARQRFVASYILEVPIFQSWRQHLWAREALGGWHLSGVTTLQTGFPVTISDVGTYNSLYCDQFSFYSCPDVPDTSTFHIKTLNPRAPGNMWFNPSDFTQEPIGTFGNVKRNFFHGPGFNYSDMSLYKMFPVGGEHREIEIRMDAYNVFNHANFSPPESNFTSAGFGGITSVVGSTTADPNGEPSAGRDVQLSGKFYF